MNVKFLPAAVLWGSLSIAATAMADAGPPPAPEKPTLGVIMPKYNGPRVADIAPRFTLPNVNGDLWSSSSQLNKNAIMLVLFGNSPVLTGNNATPESVLDSIAKTAERLRTMGVATVALSRAVGITVTGVNAQFDRLVLKDDKGDLLKFYNPSDTALTLVAIDKAGFIRRVQTVKDPATIGAAMLAIGNPTPKFEVGKPAPDFSISDMHGQVRRLSDLRGQRNLLLTFFPKCFTGG